MAGLLGLFGVGGAKNTQRSVAPRVQSSLEGRPRAVGAGQNRLAGNIVWYGDYASTPASAGGKGGAGGTGKDSTQQFNYSASFLVSVGETVAAFQAIMNGSQIDFLYTPPPALLAALSARGVQPTYGNTYNAAFMLGGYAQAPWPYLVTAHPDVALNYKGEAMVGFPNIGLGSASALPNFNFEVLWALNSDVPAFGPDANPADWVSAFLTNADWGAGFPAALIGDLTDFQTWARATGLLISPLLDGQTSGQSHLADIMQGCVATFVWSSGALGVRPYADSAVTGNGSTYTPNVTPLYDLTSADLLDCKHGPSGGAAQPSRIKVARADPALVRNQVVISYLAREGLYNPVLLTDQDDALVIAAGGIRPTDTRQHNFFCATPAASMSAALQLRQLKVLQTFYFTLPPQFILPDAMDILTLTEPALGLVRQAVRITEISEAADGSLEFTADEFLGTAGPPLYARQAPLGAGRNANESPGDINSPIIFEPPDALANGLKVWLAVSGQNPAIWGGANIWVSSAVDGTYQKVGQVLGNARMGVLTAPLPTIAEAVSGQTIDNTNTLSVTLAESAGELASGSAADMTSLNTASYVDGEIIAYQTATLTGANAYNLAPMVRGAYGTTIGLHAVGTAFARLDDLIFELPYDQSRIGSTLYIKFQSFNVYGGGVTDLADLGAVAYVIKGTALASALPDVTELRATYVDKTSAITWVEVSDFRAVRYEIRIGDSWAAGQSLGTVAHPPFVTYGDGHYWVKARSEPAAGLIVYSADALGIALVGTVLPTNLVATYDEAATGWAGTITGPGVISGPDFQTTASGTPAYYEVPVGHRFDVLYARATRLYAAWHAQGVPVGDNILTNPDFLGSSDILGAAATASIDSWVEVLVAGTGGGDVYSPADVYAVPDVYDLSSLGWVRFAPGVYYGKVFRARLAIVSYDAGVQAVATAFVWAADVETRVDHQTSYALGAGGHTFNWTPDGSSTAAAFQGGPNGAVVPQVFVSIQNASAGDTYTVTGVTLSQGTIQCFNGGVGVARTVNITVEGW